MVYLAVKNYDRAAHFFELVRFLAFGRKLTFIASHHRSLSQGLYVPSVCISQIMVEGFKKFLLVSLYLNGRVSCVHFCTLLFLLVLCSFFHLPLTKGAWSHSGWPSGKFWESWIETFAQVTVIFGCKDSFRLIVFNDADFGYSLGLKYGI